jgi:hypothetical protein
MPNSQTFFSCIDEDERFADFPVSIFLFHRHISAASSPYFRQNLRHPFQQPDKA